jgi:THO complex subunit 4
MATKLDQSLDEIMTNTGATRGGARGGARRGRGQRQARRSTGAPAPVGGISKNTRSAKGAVKATPTGPSIHRDSKIVVSNLVGVITPQTCNISVLTIRQPRDVDETQIKVCYQ